MVGCMGNPRLIRRGLGSRLVGQHVVRPVLTKEFRLNTVDLRDSLHGTMFRLSAEVLNTLLITYDRLGGQLMHMRLSGSVWWSL